MNKAITLVSGGIDSCVTLALALREYEVHPLHVSYSQRTGKRELESFRKIISFYGLKDSLVADIDFLRKIGGSSLTDFTMDIEKGAPKHGVVPSSYVPFRNTHLLAIAVSYAEVADVSKIFIGAVQDDSSGYPDCRVEYIKTFNELIRVGSKKGKDLEVVAPLIRMNRREIIEMGVKLGVPFQLTWSCYIASEVACGRCQSCYLRLKGFEEAGVKDPIEYMKGSL